MVQEQPNATAGALFVAQHGQGNVWVELNLSCGRRFGRDWSRREACCRSGAVCRIGIRRDRAEGRLKGTMLFFYGRAACQGVAERLGQRFAFPTEMRGQLTQVRRLGICLWGRGKGGTAVFTCHKW
jgi:hypothetical protein